VGVRAKAIIDWVDANLPPLSWQVIIMHNMKVFIKNNIVPSKFDDQTVLSDDIVKSISLSIKERYKKELPSTLK
jgi:hypothetical protein